MKRTPGSESEVNVDTVTHAKGKFACVPVEMVGFERDPCGAAVEFEVRDEGRVPELDLEILDAG